MKTHLLVLEAHDDLVSVRDRMSWAKTPRILLIWPVGVTIALRPVDLKLLERHARSLGARLGLMTRDRAVRREADALGLPVFRSTTTAQRDPWPVPAKRTFRHPRRVDLRSLQASAHPSEAKWKTSLLARLFFFALGVVGVLAIVAVFVPRAEIVLAPETKEQRLTVPVTADPNIEIVFITGSVPARELTRAIAGSDSLPSTGAAAIPKSEAEGVARFSNLTSAPVQIPAGTVIQTLDTPPVRFVTVRATQVEGGVGKFVETPIRSVEAGARGNQAAEAIRAVEGPLGLLVSVTNPAPTVGGTDQKIPAPSAEDRERLRTSLLAALRAQAQAEMNASLPAGSVLFPASLTETEVLEETFDPPAGEAGKTLSLSLRVVFSARYASGPDLAELAALALDASVEPGFSAVPDTLTMKPASAPATDAQGRTRFTLQVGRSLIRILDTRRALFLVQGRKPEVAQAQLSQLTGLAQPPSISLSPDWWPFLPLAPFRIAVVIQ